MSFPVYSDDCPCCCCNYGCNLPGGCSEPFPCTCPTWEHPDDFDGPEDYAAACSSCPEHGA